MKNAITLLSEMEQQCLPTQLPQDENEEFAAFINYLLYYLFIYLFIYYILLFLYLFSVKSPFTIKYKYYTIIKN